MTRSASGKSAEIALLGRAGDRLDAEFLKLATPARIGTPGDAVELGTGSGEALSEDRSDFARSSHDQYPLAGQIHVRISLFSPMAVW